MDAELISESLDMLSDRSVARKMSKQIAPLKGIRGVPMGEIARMGAAAWQEGVNLDDDDRELTSLFGGAWEDGMVAIGLLAAAGPDDPQAAWEVAEDWLGRVDDIFTADALGWLVLGPAAALTGLDVEGFASRMRHTAPPIIRRAVVMMALAWTPTPLEGPSAAPLREKVGEARIVLVPEALSPLIEAIATAFLRDEDHRVRKAYRRILRAWSKSDPEAMSAWANEVKGGFPKMLKPEIDRAHRLAKRAQKAAEDEAGEE